jgi:hypothetical protein
VRIIALIRGDMLLYQNARCHDDDPQNAPSACTKAIADSAAFHKHGSTHDQQHDVEWRQLQRIAPVWLSLPLDTDAVSHSGGQRTPRSGASVHAKPSPLPSFVSVAKAYRERFLDLCFWSSLCHQSSAVFWPIQAHKEWGVKGPTSDLDESKSHMSWHSSMLVQLARGPAVQHPHEVYPLFADKKGLLQFFEAAQALAAGDALRYDRLIEPLQVLCSSTSQIHCPPINAVVLVLVTFCSNLFYRG